MYRVQGFRGLRTYRLYVHYRIDGVIPLRNNATFRPLPVKESTTMILVKSMAIMKMIIAEVRETS